MKNYTALVYDIKFYLVDEEGNEKVNEKGNTIKYRLEEGVRCKPLEYLCEDMDIDILKEIKEKIK
jgi:hypothetical protein